jgi:hypothetical protein
VILTVCCFYAVLGHCRYPYFARWAETVAVKAVAHMNEQAVAGAAGAASSRNAAAVNDTAATTTTATAADGHATGTAAAAGGVVMCLHVRRGDKLNLPK